ncbi:MAG: hypothetical protein JKY55_20470 [Aliivibrio sp.]|uniref:hypothetical protein n=1 Tax=Aliivibrio sp. TaxID=1872443 RepID=UPI001A5D24E1|nr:hypothetical protein [Aliivibrio sp.]
MNSKKTSNETNKKAVVEQPQAPILSTQQQAAHDNATTQTKNDGSHIEQQRAARLAALANKDQTNVNNKEAS